MLGKGPPCGETRQDEWVLFSLSFPFSKAETPSNSRKSIQNFSRPVSEILPHPHAHRRSAWRGLQHFPRLAVPPAAATAIAGAAVSGAGFAPQADDVSDGEGTTAAAGSSTGGVVLPTPVQPRWMRRPAASSGARLQRHQAQRGNRRCPRLSTVGHHGLPLQRFAREEPRQTFRSCRMWSGRPSEADDDDERGVGGADDTKEADDGQASLTHSTTSSS